MSWTLLVEIDGTIHPLADCIWLFQRPCGCPCRIIPASPSMADTEQVWREIYSADKRIKRRVNYAKRDGFTLALIPRLEPTPPEYPVSGPCAHGLHVPGLQRIVLTGETYGRLTATEERRPGQSSVRARCTCGSDAVIPFSQWGITKSCGCLHRETVIARSTKHGMAGTSEYDIWAAMVQRTTNPKNKAWDDYGGRGIGVCDRWLKFENFYADMGPRPEGLTLERIDNDRGYSPENCKWATYVEQRHNQRPHRRRAQTRKADS